NLPGGTPMMHNSICGRRYFLKAAAATLFLGGASAALAGDNVAPFTITVGVSGKFFLNVPASLTQTLTMPLKRLVENQTGFGNEVVVGADHEELGRLLEEQKVKLAVMHGFEYAWLRSKYSDLKPLMVAVGEPKKLKAFLITSAESPDKGLADLAGKTLVMPSLSKQHCLMFLEH